MDPGDVLAPVAGLPAKPAPHECLDRFGRADPPRDLDDLRRPRSPLRSNGAQSAWHTTELWDFGIDVDIELPDIRNQDVEIRPWPVVLYGLFGEMWRARRAYAGCDDRPARSSMPDNSD
jgi:hypothetical protein